MYRIYFARCMNIFNSLLAQLVKYDVHTTRKINSIHAIFYHILSFYQYFSMCSYAGGKMIVWRSIKGKIIRTVLGCIVYTVVHHNHTHMSSSYS